MDAVIGTAIELWWAGLYMFAALLVFLGSVVIVLGLVSLIVHAVRVRLAARAARKRMIRYTRKP